MELKSVGKYTIVGKIGQGAMGEVYKALDPVLNRHVAIKTMTAAIGQDPELRKRFLREAQSAARLAHPNIVTLYDFGEDQGRVYMAMELLQGADLKDLIKQKNLGLDAKLDLMEQVCDALAAAHAMEVVHRDLKPANIHVQPNNQVKIVDFGLARLGASEMTKTGMVMGTPHYMSPEQVKGARADVRSDVFSLGAVFYELLGNHKPFDADSLHAVFFQVLEHEPAPVRQWDPELPEVLVPFLARALAKDPAQRYQHAGEMREALRLVRRSVTGEIDEDAALAALSGTGPVAGVAATWTPRVQGSAALAPERKPASRTTPRTLPGASATSAGAEITSVSRPLAPLIAAVAVGALLVGGGIYLWQRTQHPVGPSTAELVTRQLVMTKLQLAQSQLELKNYTAAATEARQVLELEPGNVEAQKVQEQVQGVLKQLDQAAVEARAAVKAGDLEGASKALQRVMAIDAEHPVAGELSAQLDSRFRSQAEEARQLMQRSQGAAEQAHASTQRSFGEAAAAARAAEDLFARAQFTQATQKFLASRDNFERARRAALEKEAPPTVAAAPVPTAAVPTWRPSPPPASTAHAGLPSAAPPALPPASTAATGPPAEDKAAVLGVIADYERAIETKDLGLMRRIWPTLSADKAKLLQAAFAVTQKQDVGITLTGPVEVKGTKAIVRLSRNDVINGKPQPQIRQTVNLVKQGESWTIQSIGQ